MDKKTPIYWKDVKHGIESLDKEQLRDLSSVLLAAIIKHNELTIAHVKIYLELHPSPMAEQLIRSTLDSYLAHWNGYPNANKSFKDWLVLLNKDFKFVIDDWETASNAVDKGIEELMGGRKLY